MSKCDALFTMFAPGSPPGERGEEGLMKRTKRTLPLLASVVLAAACTVSPDSPVNLQSGGSLQSQTIKVIESADMPDGPAVWVGNDPNSAPDIAPLRPMLPGYSPDVPRTLQALGAR